jgi:hypothetical protein
MLSFAGSVGCVGVLEELVDSQQCELTVSACLAAAAEGHLDALVWLHSRGCPWDVSLCHEAAFGGHLEVLRYVSRITWPKVIQNPIVTVLSQSGPCVWKLFVGSVPLLYSSMKVLFSCVRSQEVSRTSV